GPWGRASPSRRWPGCRRLPACARAHPGRSESLWRTFHPSLMWSSYGSGGLQRRALGLKHAQDVALFHDEEILAIEPDFGARPFAEQHAVADLHIERDGFAVVVAMARPHGQHFALLRLFLRRVRNDDAAFGSAFLLNAAHQHAIAK